ncbi:putative epethelial sodium channel-like 1 [Homarus americanus]|uniref:Putative epethelial sodium channel-like 1 n=1 Tax=Homarus americanus TaxID=6706 RepID=A0A8J5JPT2_HOMAM|nr:putative epethelial sodium channel-like 1 [Homarus americanus]
MSAWSRPQPSEGKTLTLPAGDDISSTGRVWRLAAVVPCAVIFCSMALLQWQDYASSPVFTSYESRYLEEVVFPGVTVCMWPPFNPKRLEDIGVKYNFSHHCVRVYNGIYYKLNSQVRRIKLKTATPTIRPSSPPFPPSTAASPLPPPTASSAHTYFILQLKKLSREYNGVERCTDAKYFWPAEDRFKPKYVHDWKCYQEHFKMYVLVHPPGHPPLLMDGITATQLVPTANKVKTRIRVSLDLYDRLKSGGCRVEQYVKFPKYTASVVGSLANQSEVEAACLTSCPETCRVLHYTTTDTTDADNNIEVAFERPMYNQILESWSYSSVQLVSNVESLASLFLGVSLYQILTCCLSQHQDEDIN